MSSINTVLQHKPPGVLNKYAGGRVGDDSAEQEHEEACDRAFTRALKRSLKKDSTNAVSMFAQICDYHQKRYDLIRATLFVVIGKKQTLKSFALWDQGQIRSGVMVQIPSERSAFYELLETQCSKTYSPAACFNGSPIEDKLAVANSSGAVLLAPLKFDGKARGLISLNSNQRRPFTDLTGVLHASLETFAAGFESSTFLGGL